MESTVRKRSIALQGHKTSVSLEEPFWEGLKELAKERGENLSDLVASIRSSGPENSNLSSAIRLHVLAHAKAVAERVQFQEERAASEQSVARRLAVAVP